MLKRLTIFFWNIEVWVVQKHVHLVDLVKSFPTNIYYLLTKIGVDTAENEPLKVHSIFKLWDLISTEPPRPLESFWQDWRPGEGEEEAKEAGTAVSEEAWLTKEDTIE